MLRIILFFLALFQMLEAKILLCAHYFNQPNFIKYQYFLFKKNLLDDHEFIVFEDARDPLIARQIQSECLKYGIRYIHIPKSVFNHPKLPCTDEKIGLHSPSFECSVATQYIYDNYVISSNDICLILDNDIFLLSPFSLENFLGEASFAYVLEKKGDHDEVTYMLPNFILFNPIKLADKESLNFNIGKILNYATDSGGYTYFYLKDHKNQGIEIDRSFLWAISKEDSFLKLKYKEGYPFLFNSRLWASHFFIQNDTFLHMRMGSNWSHNPDFPKMMAEMESFLSVSLFN